MTLDYFSKIYNHKNRCIATYRGKCGSTLRGVVLGEPSKSLTGQYFVFVDSFVNRVRIADITKIEDSGKEW